MSKAIVMNGSHLFDPDTGMFLGVLDAKGREVLGYCARCNGVHCPSCAECVPAERQLENIEAGRSPLDVSRVTVAIPRAIEG